MTTTAAVLSPRNQSLLSEGDAAAAAENPLFAPSTLPFQAPPFDQIGDAHFEPAIVEGMRLHRAEIEAIATDPAPPSFENTFVAMERAGAMLTRALQAFSAVTGANTNDELQRIQEELAPKLAAHQDAIYLDERLWRRVQAVHASRATLDLGPEALRLVEVIHDDFVRNGARLSATDKERLAALNAEESTLSTQFTNRLLAATREAALVVTDEAELAGLPAAEIAAAAQAAANRGLANRWVLPLQNTTQQPALQDLESRGTRAALFEASWKRAERSDGNDTRKLIERMAELRAERAGLLGFANHAAWKLEDQMAKTPATALDFMRRLVPGITERARSEAASIQSVIDAENGGFRLEPWDWTFYAERVRKERYDLDQNSVKPYFALDNVIEKGVFFAATQLYGITFAERRDLPVYHPDVRVFEVFDRDGSSLALFYADYFMRDNKSGGAWMDNFVNQSKLLGTKPVVVNVANFTKPAPGQPALLSFDEVITAFHEFGHALHGMFAAQEFPTLSGTRTARDFVEFPSQINEHWATEPTVFASYARHYETGEPMPEALAAKLKAARNFNAGYNMTELTAAALLDMHWHMLPPGSPRPESGSFEAKALAEAGIDLRYVPPRYRSSYFRHIWGGGYAAGYYAYLWTQMLADDGYEWFEENGGLTRANGDRFRELVLSRGNSEDLAALYRNWRGRDPVIEPMLANRVSGN